MKGKKTGMTKEESYNKVIEMNPDLDNGDSFNNESFNNLCERFYRKIPTLDFKNRQVHILLLNSIHDDGYWTNYEECYKKLEKESN
jgi:hypothetical protein